MGAIFRAVTRHVPPPAGVKPPGLWGTEERLRELFAGAISDLRVQRREFVFRFRSGDEFVDFFRAWYGPVHKAFGALDDTGREQLYADLLAVAAEFDREPGPSVALPSEYLEVVATRRCSRHSRAGARERPTASATSARDATPSLAKTLARWPSTVFSARNSRLAISRFVRPSATCSAISRSRRLRCESRAAPVLAPRARAHPVAQPAQRPGRLVAVALRAAGRELILGTGEEAVRGLAVARLRRRDARERPAARRRHGRRDRVRAPGGL